MSVSESSKTCAQAFETGFFGPYGGQFVPEALKKVLDEVNEAFTRYRDDPDFKAELADLFDQAFIRRALARVTPGGRGFADRVLSQFSQLHGCSAQIKSSVPSGMCRAGRGRRNGQLISRSILLKHTRKCGH